MKNRELEPNFQAFARLLCLPGVMLKALGAAAHAPPPDEGCCAVAAAVRVERDDDDASWETAFSRRGQQMGPVCSILALTLHD